MGLVSHHERRWFSLTATATKSKHCAMDREPLLQNGRRKPQSSLMGFLRAFWPICFISFGGPQVHVALLHDKFVDADPAYDGPKLSQPMFLELFSLAQALPGPGSTQLVASLGATFGGLWGAFVTLLMWILPGFIEMSNVGRWYHNHVNGSGDLINSLTDHSVGLIAAVFSYVLLAAFKIASNTCGFDGVKASIACMCLFIAVTSPPAAFFFGFCVAARSWWLDLFFVYPDF